MWRSVVIVTEIAPPSLATADVETPVLSVPRLAPGTELIGEYQGSGFEEPRYLVRRSDGQVAQLPHLLYVLATHVDGERSAAELARRVGAEIHRELTTEQVTFLLDERLRPSGIVAPQEEASEPDDALLRRPDPLLMLKYRAGVVPERHVWRVAGIFRPLFWRPVVGIALATFVALDVWILRNGPEQVLSSGRSFIATPALALFVMAIIIVAGMFHECGHVTACRYGGATPGGMGVGLYIVWPAMYSTVTDAYRLSRGGRLRVDLGGVYFNTVSLICLSGAYLATGAPWLLAAIILLHVETLWQFLPSIRLDGYYILADLVGVPDLFSRMGPILVSLMPGRETHPRVRELRPWVRRTVGTWVLLVIPCLLAWVVVFALLSPTIARNVAAHLMELLSTTGTAVRTGEMALAAYDVIQVIFLLLPWVGGALIAGNFAKTFTRLAASRWPVPRLRSAVRTATPPVLVLGLIVGLVALVVARVAQLASRLPATVSEGRLGELAVERGGVRPPGDFLVAASAGGYADLTGAYARHGGVITGGRELAVLAVAVLVCSMFGVAALLGVRLFCLAGAVAALAAVEPALAVLAVLSPGVLGLAWIALGALAIALSVRWPAARALLMVLGSIAVVAGVATAPLLAVPVAVATAILLGRSRERSGRRWLLAGLAVVAPVVASVAADAPGDTVRPLLVVAGLVLGAAILDQVIGALRNPRGRAWLSSSVLVVTVILAVAAAVSIPPAGARTPHASLAAWVTHQADPAVPVRVSPELRADVVRDGVPTQRLGPGDTAGSGELVAHTGDVRPGERPVAHFGSGATAIVVVIPDDPAHLADQAAREAAGRMLADDPHVNGPPQVLDALRTGVADSRALTMLAGLSAKHRVGVTALPSIAAATGPAVPIPALTIGTVDGRRVAHDPRAAEVVTRWLSAQRPPLAPSAVTTGPDGVRIDWPALAAPGSTGPPG